MGTNSGKILAFTLLAIQLPAASAGYRLLHQEYEDDTFAWDVTCSGLIMGVGFSF